MYIIKRFLFFFIPAFVLILLFNGCGKNNSFISKSKLQKKLEGTWHMVPLIDSDASTIDWTFKPDGDLIVTNLADPTYIEHGSWTVYARVVNSKLAISSLINNIYNGKWYIIDINNDRMQLNIPYKDCPDGASHCGTLQREFYRQ